MPMKRMQGNAISWFLDEHEGLGAALEGLVEEGRLRRTYTVRNWGDRKVFVKFFLERGLLGHLRNRLVPRGRKEYMLGKRMRSLSVATPLPLGYGVGAGGSFVVQDWIEGATFRAVFYEGSRRGPLLEGLSLLLRQLCAGRIRHNDLHLDNVFVGADGLYLIDLHKTKVRAACFSRGDEVANVTQALTMVYNDLTEGEKERFFALYGRPELRPLVEGGLKAQWEKWIASKKKRAFSSTSKLVAKGNRVYVRGMEEKGADGLLELIKKDKKVRIERHGDHIRKVYGSRRRLVRAWETSAALEYVTLDILPRPFFVERPFLFKEGYIAMEDLGGRGEELDRFLDREYDSMSEARRRAFIDAFSRFLAGLLSLGVVQLDLKACNVFVVRDGFRLLDAEDIAFFAPDEKDLARMLVQLASSIPARVRASDRIRFFLKLTAPLPFERKGLFRDVAEACRGEEIVYEGVSGLKREAWQGRRPGSPSPFGRPPR
jgi:tRNA A-37 threonylcarbamoyl transferase component Bud32